MSEQSIALVKNILLLEVIIDYAQHHSILVFLCSLIVLLQFLTDLVWCCVLSHLIV